MLTPGQAHDLTCAEPLLESVDPEALLGDKAFDADHFIDAAGSAADAGSSLADAANAINEGRTAH